MVRGCTHRCLTEPVEVHAQVSSDAIDGAREGDPAQEQGGKDHVGHGGCDPHDLEERTVSSGCTGTHSGALGGSRCWQKMSWGRGRKSLEWRALKTEVASTGKPTAHISQDTSSAVLTGVRLGCLLSDIFPGIKRG